MNSGWLGLILSEAITRSVDLLVSLFKPSRILKEIAIIIKAKEFSPKIKKKKVKRRKSRKKLSDVIYGWKEGYVYLENREIDLRKQIIDGKDIRIISEAGRGKTRTAVEVVKYLAQNYEDYKKVTLVFFPKDTNLEKVKLGHRFLKLIRGRIILLFDDIDQIALNNRNLFKQIRDFKKLRKKNNLLCTCRKEKWSRQDSEWLDLKDSIKAYFPLEIDIPKINQVEGKLIANRLKLKFPTAFSGNAADILLETPSKKSEYKKLPDENKIILRAIKLLKIANIQIIKPDLLKSVVIRCFNFFEQSWITKYTLLRDSEFFREERGNIEIPDVYLNSVINDYPPYKEELANIAELEVYFKCLEELLLESRMNQEILSLSISFNLFNLFQNSLIMLKKVENEFSHSSLYFLNRGLAYAKTGNVDSAIQDFTILFVWDSI